MTPSIEDIDRTIDVNRFLMSFYMESRMPLRLAQTFVRHLRLVYIRWSVIGDMS